MRIGRLSRFSPGHLVLSIDETSFVILLLFGWMGALLLWSPGSPLLVPLGLFNIFFSPGYALLAALYPTEVGLSQVQRISGSLGLSAICAGWLFLLVSLTFGVNLPAVFFALAGWTGILVIIAIYRRRKRPAAERWWARTPLQIPRPVFRPLARPGLASLLIALSLAIAGLAAIRLVWTSTLAQPQYTEFYLLDEAGQITGYPTQVIPGNPLAITIGIDNHSATIQHYQLTYQVIAGSEIPLRELEVKPGELWLVKPEVNAMDQPGLQQIKFILREGHDDGRIQTLYLWVETKSTR